MNARACLLSGPPGIGKTTAAGVAARLQGLQLLEFNASDTRNKAHIEELQDLVTGGVTVNFFKLDKSSKASAAGAAERGKLPCLLLDEVDGLSGGDRGGSQAMLKLIDETRIPIICVCNDRMSTKVRTLAGRCLDLRFEKPTAAALKIRMRQIAAAENIPVSDERLASIAEVSGGDMRQCVGQLQLLASQLRHQTAGNQGALCASKDAQVMLGSFECCKLLLDSRTGKRLKLREKTDYFFVDYDMLPLLMQGVQQKAAAAKTQRGEPSAELVGLNCCVRAAKALALADIASTTLRTCQEWSLLPTMGAFCCVDVPAEVHKVDGFIPRVNFPAWFGRNRLFSELLLQLLRNPTSGSSIGSLKLSGYLDALYTMEKLYEKVDSKAKAAFTRHCSALQQTQINSKSSRRAKASDSLKQALEGEELGAVSDASASETESDENQPKKKPGATANNKRGGKAAGASRGAPSRAPKGTPKGPTPKAAASRGRRGGKGKV